VLQHLCLVFRTPGTPTKARKYARWMNPVRITQNWASWKP